MNINIRIATPDDAEALSKIYAYYVENTAVSFETVPPSGAEFAKRIEKTLKRYPYLVAEVNGEAVGYCYLSQLGERAAYAWCAETSIYVRSDCRRGRIGGQLYTAVERIAVRQGITDLWARVAAPRGTDNYLNDGSMYFHERVGYELKARLEYNGNKFGHWYDMLYLHKNLLPHLDSPAPIIPFAELERTL